MLNYEFHEVANIFPMMSAEEHKALVDDIKQNGLIEPIWLHFGKIIDGRNRYMACIEADVEPRFRTYNGAGDEDLVQFVVSLNQKRRHLDKGQLAFVALAIEAQLAEIGKRRKVEAGGWHGNQYAKPTEDLAVLAKLPNAPKVDLLPQTLITQTNPVATKLTQPAPIKAREQAAAIVGVSDGYVKMAKKLAEDAPDLAAKVKAGEVTISEASKALRSQEIQQQRAEIAKAGQLVKPADKWHIYHGDISQWTAPRQYDHIITDPPYPKEYLQLYEVLAERAKQWLKPGGLLIAMAGQSYLDEIYAMMSKHLEYYWTACYLTPGQPTPLRQVNVNTTWKPLLIFGLKGQRYNGKIFGDVFKSDGNDKDFHKWGQSISGMCDIVSKICLPGQYILDPFNGAGTTGIAALKHGCLYDGLELDIMNVNISKERLHDATTAI